jgi:hypothetical protein
MPRLRDGLQELPGRPQTPYATKGRESARIPCPLKELPLTDPIPGAGISYWRPPPKEVVAARLKDTLRRLPRELSRVFDPSELAETLKRYHGIPKRPSPENVRRSPSGSFSSSSLRPYADQQDQVTTEWLNWLSQGRAGFWDYWREGESTMLKPFLEWVQTPPEKPVRSGVLDCGCGLGRLDPEFSL